MTQIAEPAAGPPVEVAAVPPPRFARTFVLASLGHAMLDETLAYSSGSARCAIRGRNHDAASLRRTVSNKSA